MKVFIIGGTGVLSTDILEECLKHDDIVYVLTRGRNKLPDSNYGNLYQIVCDIRNTDEVAKKVEGQQFDVVIDFLSFTPEHLAETFRIFAPKCKQYVFISSCCVFRRSKEDGVINENSPKPNEILSYGYNKYKCEELLKVISSQYDCNYTIVRPYITYGDTRIPFGLSPVERYHWTMIGRILADKPFFIWDDGSNKCSLLHTKDFAKIFYHLLQNEKAYNDDVNITGNTPCSWMHVLELLYSSLNKDIANIINIPQDIIARELPEFRESLYGDRALDAVFDNSKLQYIVPETKLILENSISLSEGIKQTIKAYQSNNYYRGIDYKYDGRVDRMLLSYLPSSSNKRNKIVFVDYLGNNQRKDKIKYLFYQYSSNYLLQTLRKIKSLLG